MNTFLNRLSQIEVKNQNNPFKRRIDLISRKGTKIIDKKDFHYEEFLFNGNLHSNKIECEKFTNFISSYDTILFGILKNLFTKLHKGQYQFFDEFQLDENNYCDSSAESKRLKRIIMEVNGINEVPEINEMIPVQYLKRKEKRYSGIRLFVHVREDGFIELYLIDLYHLGIDAYNVTTGNYDMNRNYNSNENCNKCISKIADEFIDDETI